jgi:hypothetical protein
MNTRTITLGNLPFTAVVHRRWVIVIGAMAAAIAVWTVIDPFMGVDLVVKTAGGSTQQISQLAVALTSLFVGFAGWATVAALERFARRPRTAWTVVAGVVLALSLLGPLSGVTTGAKVGLLVLHLVVGSILLFGLARTTRHP